MHINNIWTRTEFIRYWITKRTRKTELDNLIYSAVAARQPKAFLFAWIHIFCLLAWCAAVYKRGGSSIRQRYSLCAEENRRAFATPLNATQAYIHKVGINFCLIRIFLLVDFYIRASVGVSRALLSVRVSDDTKYLRWNKITHYCDVGESRTRGEKNSKIHARMHLFCVCFRLLQQLESWFCHSHLLFRKADKSNEELLKRWAVSELK